MAARLVDTHCHLDLAPFASDLAAVVDRAREAGVARILVPGIDLAGSRRVLALAEAYPEIRAAVGLHPNSAADLGQLEASLAELRRLAEHPKVDAIGEIGIDLYWKSVPLAVQQQAFRAQLALAESLGKPVIVHDREAHAAVMAELGAHAPAAGVVLHAFSGDAAMAQAALNAGYWLGVAGPLTYKKSEGLRAIFAAAPLDQVLIETDAPYLAPQSRRGARNEPAFVREVAEQLARVKALPFEAVAAATTASAARLFQWESVA